MKTIRVVVSSIATAGALTLSLTAAASAHTVDEAIRYGCGSNYRELDRSERDIMIGTTRWGQVHLAYDGTTDFNCAVTRKTQFHGTASRVRAVLVVQGVGDFVKEDPDAGHWESVKAYGRGRCVKYAGAIWNPAGTVIARGNEPNWSYCR